MLAVGVGIREDTNLVVAQTRKIAGTRVDTDRHADVVHFLRRTNFARLKLPSVQDLAAQRHDGLKIFVARLLGGAARRVSFDQKEFRARGIIARTVSQFPG